MKRIKLFENFEEGSDELLPMMPYLETSFVEGDYVIATLEDGSERRGKIVGISHGYGATMYEVDLGGNDIVHLPDYGLRKV